MPSIEVDFPCSGSTVARHFTATGTWTLDATGTPAITAELQNGSGGTVGSVAGTAAPATGTAGTWSAEFTLSADFENLALLARLTSTTAEDDQSGINVQDSPPLVLDPLPGLNPPPGPPIGGGLTLGATGTGGNLTAALTAPAAAVTYTVTGKSSGKGAGVVCTAAVCKPNGNWSKVLGAAAAQLDTPNPGEWTAHLQIDPSDVPAAQKSAVVAALLHAR
ncbi:MAG TPA: hypothetical protein VGE74_12665, partial [Gemmata sp.]